MTTTQHAPTRDDLAAAIADGKRKYDRMPAHWGGAPQPGDEGDHGAG